MLSDVGLPTHDNQSLEYKVARWSKPLICKINKAVDWNMLQPVLSFGREFPKSYAEIYSTYISVAILWSHLLICDLIAFNRPQLRLSFCHKNIS